MQRKHALILSGFLVSIAPLGALAQDSKDWIDIRDPNELRALYSNKTFKGNDQVCVKLPWDSPCYRFLRHKSKRGVYRSINVANDEVTEYSVEDGVPQF